MDNPQPDYSNKDFYEEAARRETREAKIKVLVYAVVSALVVGLLIWWLKSHIYISPLDMNKLAALQSHSGLHQVGSLPADICVIDGAPQVLNVNFEPALGGGPTLTYLRNNGDLVVLKYSNTDYSRLDDTFVWSGGHCGARGQ